MRKTDCAMNAEAANEMWLGIDKKEPVRSRKNGSTAKTSVKQKQHTRVKIRYKRNHVGNAAK